MRRRCVVNIGSVFCADDSCAWIRGIDSGGWVDPPAAGMTFGRWFGVVECRVS